MKATLVLLPLLGITYMLFFVNPGEDDLSQIVFIYFNSFLQSFQVGRGTTWGSFLPWHAQTPVSSQRPHTGLLCTWFTLKYKRVHTLNPSPGPWHPPPQGSGGLTPTGS